MATAINLNADMGEGFGAYDIGDDAGLLKVIRSASIACGFHAGDPVTMQRVVTQAVAEGVSIGAHPGFNDLWGFGRRRIDMNPSELEYMIAYQIGALQAMACYAGAKVTHLKPHGSLNNMAAENLELAMQLVAEIRETFQVLVQVRFLAAGGTQVQLVADEFEQHFAVVAANDLLGRKPHHFGGRGADGEVPTARVLDVHDVVGLAEQGLQDAAAVREPRPGTDGGDRIRARRDIGLVDHHRQGCRGSVPHTPRHPQGTRR